jgi:hypothetical protein
MSLVELVRKHYLCDLTLMVRDPNRDITFSNEIFQDEWKKTNTNLFSKLSFRVRFFWFLDFQFFQLFSVFWFFSFLAFLVVKVFEGGKRFPPIAFLLTVTDDA